MNESEFEQQLRGLKPARPSRQMENRISRELAPALSPHAGTVDSQEKSWLERLLPALGWCSLGAAAAVVAMLSINLAEGRHTAAPQAQAAPAAKATPLRQAATAGAMEDATASVAEEVLEASDEGVFDSEEQGPGRRVRYSSVERRSWRDATGAITEVEIPREDVFLLPVSFQ